jgi:hypothetical protein
MRLPVHGLGHRLADATYVEVDVLCSSPGDGLSVRAAAREATVAHHFLRGDQRISPTILSVVLC